MATYCYTTNDGQTVERTYPIGQMPKTVKVGRKVARLDVGAMHSLQRGGQHGYPYWSDAFFANPEVQQQWIDHYAKNGIKDVEFHKDGRLKVNSAEHRRALMKANGYVDFNSYY